MTAVRTVFVTREFQEVHGTIKIEEWPEGIVLWFGGKIKFKSWIVAPVLGMVEDAKEIPVPAAETLNAKEKS